MLREFLEVGVILWRWSGRCNMVQTYIIINKLRNESRPISLFFNIIQKYIINRKAEQNIPKTETLKGSENLADQGRVNRPKSQ